MNIYEKTESVLALLFDSYYHGMPDFGEGQEPDRYAVYTVLHKPEHFVAGRKTADSYFIMLSIFTPRLDPSLYDKAENAFTDKGYIFQQGRRADFDNGFPQKTHYSMDFIISADA
ncbi:MAG: hypothetical protein NC394_10530 [Bacteroides sp.]|nr:hypothetical protein [Bacteroides sp.]